MKKVLAILLALVMVAVCGCAKPEEKKPVVEEKPVYTVRDGFVTDLEDVNFVEYSNGEKTITMELLDGAWFYKDDSETWINQTTIALMVKTAAQMAYNEEVKDVKALADYGLEKPIYSIKMENEDGFIVTLYIGNMEGEEECYVTTDDKKVVYKVSSAIVGTLEFDEEDLLAKEIDPMQYLKDMEYDEMINQDELGISDEVLTDDAPAPGQNPEEDTTPEDEPQEPSTDNQNQDPQ